MASRSGSATSGADASAAPPSKPRLPSWVNKMPRNAFDEGVCKRRVEWSYKHAPHVIFLREAMKKLGCPRVYDNNQNTLCVSCPMALGGGYHPPSKQILLCQNRIRGDEEMTKTLTHEMVHAFDDCRANLDWTDCVHHACTEIRASNVSRECRWLEEFKRLQIHGVNGQKSCVRRRAELSVGMNPFCNKPGQARLAVEAAWETCYRDTAPFENCP